MYLNVCTLIASKINWENVWVIKFSNYIYQWAQRNNIKIAIQKIQNNRIPIAKKIDDLTLLYQPTSKPNATSILRVIFFLRVCFFFVEMRHAFITVIRNSNRIQTK